MIRSSLALLVLTSGLQVASGADLESAELTEIVKDVNLLLDSGDTRAAEIGDKVLGSTAVTTGRRSRAELEFNDLTLLRLGANTTFSLSGGKREIDLKEGAVLLQTAPGGGGVNIRAGSVTAAITGSMGLLSVSPPADGKLEGKELYVKFISIHGEMSLEIDGQVYQLEPFQMIFLRVDLEGNLLGTPVITTLDGEKLVQTSNLINGFEDESRIDPDEILAQLDVQNQEMKNNIWTRVTHNVENRVTGLPGRNTLGLGSIIRGFPMPTPPAPPTPPPAPPKPPAPPTPPPPPPGNPNLPPGETTGPPPPTFSIKLPPND